MRAALGAELGEAPLDVFHDSIRVIEGGMANSTLPW
jgi:hypothetical protein